MNNFVYPELCAFENRYLVNSCVTSEKVALPIENKFHQIRNRLFVKGIPRGTTTKELKQFFSVNGKVIDCNILEAKKPNQEFLYGFVTFHQTNGDKIVSKLICDFRNGKVNFEFNNCNLLIDHAFFKQKKKSKTQSSIGTTDNLSNSDSFRNRGRFPTSLPPYPGFNGNHVVPYQPIVHIMTQFYIKTEFGFLPIYAQNNPSDAPY